MKFLNPWGLTAFAAVPVLIALYILKQKHKEVRVPSLYLWKKTRVMLEASTPFQRLKRNLLFFLQLAAIIILALCISQPVTESRAVYDETIVVIDASASMQAIDGDESRFERAVDEAMKLADRLSQGKKMSVIFSGDGVYPAVSHSDSKYEIKKIIKQYKCGYTGTDLDSAVLLADSMRSEDSNCSILIYTDKNITSDKDYAEYINVSLSDENCAVLTLKSGYNGTDLMALSTVVSYGCDKDITLELTADGQLCDAKNISLKEAEIQSVYWTDIPADTELLCVKITESDILPLDDSLCTAVSRDADRQILVVSDSGFFWEKVLSAVCSYKVFKCSPADYAALDTGLYDLIIYDCYSPDNIPSDCPCLLIGTDIKAEDLSCGSLIKGTSLSAGTSALSSEICEYVNPSSIVISQFRELTASGNWQTVLKCGEYPAVLVRENENGIPLTVFAFDIHDSNLPLLKDFPIMVSNLLSYSLPDMAEGDGIYEAGSTVTVKKLPYSVKTEIFCPDGTTAEPDGDRLMTFEMPGLYKITQTLERNTDEGKKESTVSAYLFFCIPAGESSTDSATASDLNTEKNTYRGQLELRPYLCALLLLLLAAEWWVYNRES